MNQISIVIVGLAAAFAGIPAWAEDFTAGKTPAQLFRSDCVECHRSPNGLVKDRRDVRELASFLREHYTTRSETAGALAAYVSGFAGGPAARNRGTGVAEPPTRDRSRGRSDVETPAGIEDVPANPRSAEEAGVRRRRVGLSGDNEKRRARDDGEARQAPHTIVTASPKSNSRARISQPHDADDAISRLRSYLSSGMSSESAIAEAGKTGAPKARKRRNTEDVQAGAKLNADAPVAEPAAAPPATPAAAPPPTPDAASPQTDAPPEAAEGEP